MNPLAFGLAGRQDVFVKADPSGICKAHQEPLQADAQTGRSFSGYFRTEELEPAMELNQHPDAYEAPALSELIRLKMLSNQLRQLRSRNSLN
ncbi:hypothetical protein I6F35_37520 [Bradyrhizobium sp. BRP22]|uniref:hypothetical protein n=1 Tax=Bradyrhizobium sp. BRP22 TaxID=2793821 RepID=UPI001CD6D17A|nr:hypothetical protein [Bradyrhizobium sp. BRP22]MCA1458796.1 hypothetical protein [Bradyrhizobium sp. BRP22]